MQASRFLTMKVALVICLESLFNINTYNQVFRCMAHG